MSHHPLKPWTRQWVVLICNCMYRLVLVRAPSGSYGNGAHDLFLLVFTGLSQVTYLVRYVVIVKFLALVFMNSSGHGYGDQALAEQCVWYLILTEWARGY